MATRRLFELCVYLKVTSSLPSALARLSTMTSPCVAYRRGLSKHQKCDAISTASRFLLLGHIKCDNQLLLATLAFASGATYLQGTLYS